jgi:hypothetical protein
LKNQIGWVSDQGEDEKLNVKSHELMLAYLKLSPADRYEFDRLYAGRVRLLKLCAHLRRATPEQLREVKKIMSVKRGGTPHFSSDFAVCIRRL